MLLVMGAGWLVVFVCTLIALTAGVVRYLWAYQKAWTPGLGIQKLVGFVFWAAAGAVAFFLPLASIPPNIGIIFSAMLVALVIHAVVLRQREFASTLNDMVLTVCTHGGRLSDVLRALAWGKPYVMAGRIRLFCVALDRGADPVQAARLTRLPLEIDTMLALQHRGELGAPVGTLEAEESDLELPPTDLWPAGSQLAYLVSLLVGGAIIANFLLLFIVPTFDAMFEEFNLQTIGASPGGPVGRAVLLVGLPLLLIGLSIVGLLMLFLWLTDYRWLARCLPLIGPLMLSHRRANCLRGLARVIESGREASVALANASEMERRHGQRTRLRKAASLVGAGTAFAPALGQAGLIERSAEPWVTAAAANDRLPPTLRALAESMRRRARVRFDSAMSIIFPLGVVVAGMFVLWLAWWVIGSLAGLIHGLS